MAKVGFYLFIPEDLSSSLLTLGDGVFSPWYLMFYVHYLTVHNHGLCHGVQNLD